MCFFPDAFKVDISLKDIKGTTLLHQHSLLLSFLVLKVFPSICPPVFAVFQLFSTVFSFFANLPLLCEFCEFCSLSRLSLPASPPLGSLFLPPHGLHTSMWFPLISAEMCFVFSPWCLFPAAKVSALPPQLWLPDFLLRLLFLEFFFSFSFLTLFPFL